MEKRMYDSLVIINNKYEDLNHKINTIKIATNIKEYTKITKEINSIKEIANTFEKYLGIEKLIKESKEIIKNELDIEIIDMAKIELSESITKLVLLEDKLKVLLIPKDDNDDKNVILEIRGAAGGNEANIFAGNLFDIYQKWAFSNDMKITLIDSTRGESGGFSIIVFKIEGKKAFSKLKFESGVHRVQRIPTTETQGRVHTSTATVIVMPEADETIDIEILTTDLRIDTYRSSGAGGQSVNTTDSAVRITHIPTGITASSQDGKNQLFNKDLAMKTLKTRLYNLEIKKKQEKIGIYRKLAGSGDRSEKIRTYNYPQDRVTDHRILFSISLKNVLDGKLNPIINALLAEEQAEKIKELGI